MPATARTRVAALTVAGVLAASGCGVPGGQAAEPPGSALQAGSPAGAGVPAAAGPAAVVEPLGRLRGPLREPDLLVVGPRTLPPRVRQHVARTAGVVATLPMAVSAAPVRGRMLTVAAADPSAYRRFTPPVTARAASVWQRVAEGDLAITPELAQDLGEPLGGHLVLGGGGGPRLRVGAHASLHRMVDAVVNPALGAQLGMVPGNALLVSTDGSDPERVAGVLQTVLGRHGTVSQLSLPVSSGGEQTAFLTGGSVAEAVGSFGYRWFPDGTVAPDPAWVAASIRTEPVPILGQVTCHRVMLPQLRAALAEVVALGLEHLVDAGDYGGCYVPRFIGHDPERGLSLHTWGIAVDLNVAGNQRGTTGEIDRRVVDVFKRWGFAWGGDWSYTDPMHFELVALVRTPQ